MVGNFKLKYSCDNRKQPVRFHRHAIPEVTQNADHLSTATFRWKSLQVFVGQECLQSDSNEQVQALTLPGSLRQILWDVARGRGSVKRHSQYFLSHRNNL